MIARRPTSLIFDRVDERIDPAPMRHDEQTFDFYDRCSNPVVGTIRHLLEGWFGRYPRGKDRNDLLGRLRDGDRRQFGSAVWELYIHESLIRQGFAVTPHPRLGHTTARPDFLAEQGADRLYVECTIVTHPDDAEARRSAVGNLEAAIDESGIADYWLALDIEQRGEGAIPPAPFVAALRAWIEAQDIETMATLARHGFDRLPTFRWQHGDWVARLTAIPRSPDLRGRAEIRPLGVMAAEEDERRHVWQPCAPSSR